LFPWQFKGNTNFGEVVMTDKPLLFKIILGGFLEFVGAQAAVISFNGTLAAGMNGGICGAIIALNTVYVLIVAYCMFGEKLNKVKFVAILFLVASVILVSLFTPDLQDVLDAVPDVGSTTENQIIQSMLTEDDMFNYKL
jgi:drug/metabolite transporter (DMT)-like permease